MSQGYHVLAQYCQVCVKITATLLYLPYNNKCRERIGSEMGRRDKYIYMYMHTPTEN